MLKILFNVSLVIFMVGNLLDMGLRLELKEAVRGLRDVRFVILTLVWGFVLCPALAWGIAKVMPMDPSYGIGLILLGMAPCAPYLPLVVDKARGDIVYAATTMVLAAVGTVIFMPIAVPLMITGLTVSAWAIAKPLLLLVLVPLVVGTAIRAGAKAVAIKIHPFVKMTTSIGTVVLVVVIFIMYGKDFISAIGSYTILAQLLFLAVAGGVAYLLGFGLAPNQKSVLTLGLVSRNIGPAIAPLLAASVIDHRALTSALIGLPITVIASFLAAFWFARRASAVQPAVE